MQIEVPGPTHSATSDASSVPASGGDRTNVQEALRASEERFRTIFHRSLDAVMIVDGRSGQILSMNQATHRILGYDSETLIGRDFSMLFPPASDVSRKEFLEKLKVYEAVVTQEFLRADGSACLMDLTATVIPWEEDQAILITLRDITERVRAEEEQERLIGELREALDKVKTLSGLLPICASCKKIRDDRGYWHQVEMYVADHSEAEFSHWLCPECAKKLYPEFYEEE